ncbi:MAG: ABC transporter permease [Ruminococcus sp.]|uniref:ABC transporter permease n=1 Tax=Ruminococcus sp. TaxID=41978 RepID=UPI0025FC2A27|nr:ABC transporter permease subunit [Ruminococcus sp.]MBR5684457.1 ABC transporter permease [Ruminococcus sp.]
MFPIYKKELQSFFYTPFAYAIAALFLLLFTLPLASSISKIEGTNRIVFSFTEMFYAVILYFIFLLPILTMRTFADERKNGTEVLLMTSPVSVAKIVIAKFLANLTVYIFMLVCSFFFPILTAIKGEVVMSQLICAYIGIFCWGAMYIALGMLISSFTENSIIAAIIGEVVMFILLYVDEFANSGFISQFPKLQSVIYSFAAKPRFAYFSEGFIRISDLVFFGSAVIVLLAWTFISIEKRRWNRG